MSTSTDRQPGHEGEPRGGDPRRRGRPRPGPPLPTVPAWAVVSPSFAARPLHRLVGRKGTYLPHLPSAEPVHTRCGELPQALQRLLIGPGPGCPAGRLEGRGRMVGVQVLS